VRLAYVVSASPTRFAAVGSAQNIGETLRDLAALGFDGVELAIRDPSIVPLDEIAAAVSGVGLAVPAIGTGQAYLEEGLSLTAPDPAVRDRTRARLAAQIDVAARFGALLIIGLIHGPVPPGTGRDEAAARLLDELDTVARIARQAAVRIVIEPVNRYESNWLNTVDDVMDLIGRLRAENVGVLPDTFHMNIEESDPAAALRRAASRLWHVHIADSNRHAPGDGHLDFAGIIAALEALRYAGWISAEILQQPTLLDAAARTSATIRRLLHRA
jgi:5-keto-L-gluconate epimerase